MRIGKVERFILDHLEEHGPDCVLYIAVRYHNRNREEQELPIPRATYESVRRAAHRLEEKEKAECYYSHLVQGSRNMYRLFCGLPEHDHHMNETQRITRPEAREAILTALDNSDGDMHRTALHRAVNGILRGPARKDFATNNRTVERALEDLIDEGVIARYEGDGGRRSENMYGNTHYRLNVDMRDCINATQH